VTTAPASALRASAAGLSLKADTGLLIARGTLLHHSGFTRRFIRHAASIADGTTEMARNRPDGRSCCPGRRRTALHRRRAADLSPRRR
jgi:hypothetical protein